MNTRFHYLVLITVILTAWSAGAGQLPVRVDLTSATSNPGYEYCLETANVLRNGSPTPDMAVCLSRAQITPNGLLREPSGRLVAFIAADKNAIEAIASQNAMCQGPDCSELEIKGADHNLQFDTAPYKRFCTDPSGIAKQFGYHEVQLGDLLSMTRAKLDITIFNTYDESMTVLGVTQFGLRQTCEVPDDDTDIRYGRNWFADIWGPSPWMPGYSLYVCSEGVRVCSFSYEFMANEFHQAVIVANDQHNTVIHASNARGYFGGHECGLARDAHGGAIGRYFIEGWDRGWQIGLRIEGLGGNDWVLGSPEPDLLMGGDGDDLLRGMAGRSNRMYGEDGHDIMHDSTTGACDGGSPAIDTHCAADSWDWPNPYPAGDCCCAGCGPPVSCVFSDLTPGVAEVPPDPW